MRIKIRLNAFVNFLFLKIGCRCRYHLSIEHNICEMWSLVTKMKRGTKKWIQYICTRVEVWMSSRWWFACERRIDTIIVYFVVVYIERTVVFRLRLLFCVIAYRRHRLKSCNLCNLPGIHYERTPHNHQHKHTNSSEIQLFHFILHDSLCAIRKSQFDIECNSKPVNQPRPHCMCAIPLKWQLGNSVNHFCVEISEEFNKTKFMISIYGLQIVLDAAPDFPLKWKSNSNVRLSFKFE